jgi:parallel beta-helix repeat protein
MRTINKKVILAIALILAISIFSIAIGVTHDFLFGSRTLIVDDDEKADYALIQRAIDDARSGDTVFVRNGTYDENLYIKKTLKLVAEDRNNTIIFGGGGNCIEVKAHNFFISNFIVTKGKHGIYVDRSSKGIMENITAYDNDCGICLNDSKKCKIASNNMTDNKRAGLEVKYKYDNSISESNTINGEHVYYFYNASMLLIENKTLGHLTLANCSHSLIKNNTLKWDGISLINSFNITLTDNKLKNNTYHALTVEGKYENSMDQTNTINGEPIYYADDADGDLIENKTFGKIFLANCTHFIIKNSMVSGDGVFLVNSTDNEIKGNNILNNLDYGIFLTKSNDNQVCNNTILRNKDGIRILDSDNSKMQMWEFM